MALDVSGDGVNYAVIADAAKRSFATERCVHEDTDTPDLSFVENVILGIVRQSTGELRGWVQSEAACHSF